MSYKTTHSEFECSQEQLTLRPGSAIGTTFWVRRREKDELKGAISCSHNSTGCRTYYSLHPLLSMYMHTTATRMKHTTLVAEWCMQDVGCCTLGA